MSAIEALKLAAPIAVKTAAGAPKAKTEAPIENGAFSKLLSAFSKEESIEQQPGTAELLVAIETALAELQQLPTEDLQPQQQELLVALAQLLVLHQAQPQEKVEAKPSGYVKSAQVETVQQDAPLKGPVFDASIKEKLVGLMRQIAHKAQELGHTTAKEFADVPIFMGVEKEYILNKPNKVNEIINMMVKAAENLETVKEQERPAVSAKLAHNVQELLQQFSGTVESVELPEEPQHRNELPPLAPKLSVQAAAATPDAAAASENIEPAPAITVPLEAPKSPQSPIRPEPAAPAPVIRMANLADDLSTVLSSTAKLSGTGETAQLKVSIFPEHLGQLDIRLSTVDGKVAAQIVASSPMAKEALELQVYQLRNAMVQQGIQIDRIEISTQQSLSQQQGQQEQRFARQQRQQQPSKNGYQQSGEEAPGAMRGVSTDHSVMGVDYTI